MANILITGCGGDVGLALARILKDVGVDRVIGADMITDHPGRAFFHECIRLPKAGDKGYLRALWEAIQGYQIDIVVPTSDAELSVLAGVYGDLGNALFVMPNADSIHTFGDKYLTYRFLVDNALPHPWTTDLVPRSVPCISKPRIGQGSKGFEHILVQAQVYNSMANGRIYQELLKGQEYSCGLYRAMDGEIRTIQFHRVVVNHQTQIGEVHNNPLIYSLLLMVAKAIDLRGSVNVQLMLTAEGPKIFEINPRFSGSVRFRHKLGFKDFVWALMEARGEKLPPYNPKSGRFWRTVEETVIED